MNTDKITTWLGFWGSVLVILQNRNLIDEDIAALIYVFISLLFGYFTNKVRVRREPPRDTKRSAKANSKVDIAGIDFDI